MNLLKKIIFHFDKHQIDLQFPNTKILSLYFNTPNRCFYFSLIALIYYEMKQKDLNTGKNTYSFISTRSIQIENKLLKLNKWLLNKDYSTDVEDIKKMFGKIRKAWRSPNDLSNLEKTKFFNLSRKRKESHEGKIFYDVTDIECDIWQQLIQYNKSNTWSFKFGIDNIGLNHEKVEFKYQNKKDQEAWQEYLKHLEDLYNKKNGIDTSLPKPLKNRYELFQPAVDLLQINPISDEYATPKFFRKTGPVYADIENGKVFVGKYIVQLTNLLDQKKAVLLIGNAASGKSVISRVVAKEWIDKKQHVFFLNLKAKQETIEISKLVNELDSLREETQQPLIVIEDTHLKSNLINEFISKRESDWPQLLITARPSYDSNLLNSEINYFDNCQKCYLISEDPIDEYVPLDEKSVESEQHWKESLKAGVEWWNSISMSSAYAHSNDNQTYFWKIEDLTEEIIDKYFKANKWYYNEGIKDSIKQISKSNLWLLSYVLKSLKTSNGQELANESILREVYRDLDEIAYKNPLYVRLLLALSFLSRFEIATDIRFLFERFQKDPDVIEKALRDLKKDGEVILKKSINNNVLYELPHSTLADLYFEFTKSGNSPWSDECYGDEQGLLWSYCVSMNSINGIDVLKDKICKMKLVDKIRLPSKLKKIAKKIDITNDVFEIIYLFKYIAEVYENNPPKMDLKKSLFFNKKNKNPIKILWDCIDKNHFFHTIFFHNQSDLMGMMGLEQCFLFVNKLSKDINTPLWNQMDLNIFVEAILKSNSVTHLPVYLAFCESLTKEHGEKILFSIGAKKMLNKMDQVNRLEDYKMCLFIMKEISETFFKKIIRDINILKLSEKITESKNFPYINEAFICLPNELVNKVLIKIVNKKLAMNFIVTKNLPCSAIIFYFLSSIDKDKKQLSNLWEMIDKQSLVDRIIETKALSTLKLWISNLQIINKNWASEFCKKIIISKNFVKLKDAEYDETLTIINCIAKDQKTNLN